MALACPIATSRRCWRLDLTGRGRRVAVTTRLSRTRTGRGTMTRIVQLASFAGFTLLGALPITGCSGSTSNGSGSSAQTGGNSSSQGGSSSIAGGTSTATGGVAVATGATGGVTTAFGGTTSNTTPSTGGVSSAGGASCGLSSAPCCSSATNKCNVGLTCQGATATVTGVCQPCGDGYGYQPCCDPGGTCRSGICISGRCNPDYALVGGRPSLGGTTSTTGGTVSATGGRNAGGG